MKHTHTIPIPNSLICGECCEEKESSHFEELELKESIPQCNECKKGFWEMMGDDPHGKDWG